MSYEHARIKKRKQKRKGNSKKGKLDIEVETLTEHNVTRNVHFIQ